MPRVRRVEQRERVLRAVRIPPGNAAARQGVSKRQQQEKGGRRMPRLSEAMKDVISCDKPRVGANDL
jgi:hypothetical protein